MENQKLPYEAPRMEKVGDVRDVTQSNASGAATDQTFPNNTPTAELLFS